MNEFELKEKQDEIIQLAIDLIKIPAISVGGQKNPEGIRNCFEFIANYLKKSGVRIIEYQEQNTIPGLYCDLNDKNSPLSAQILFLGHYDRVSPNNPKQMHPIIDGDWLKARGATDMLTTVATAMVLIKDLKIENRKLKFGILLVGNEESGETEKWGTPHILEVLADEYDYKPKFAIIGERTGEGASKIGKIEYKNRGLIRAHIQTSGKSEHSAQLTNQTVVDRIMHFRNDVQDLFSESQHKNWKSTFSIPYFIAGEIENFNTTPDSAIAGLEIRPIPEDDFAAITSYLEKRARELEIELEYVNKEPGIITNSDHQIIQKLLDSISTVIGKESSDYLGPGKLHATQARFLRISAIIFGQCGVGPHSDNEAHYIPSIIPYYLILKKLLCTYPLTEFLF